jgi:hypothetical protein
MGRLLKREGISHLADLMPAEEGTTKPKKRLKTMRQAMCISI